MKITDLVYWQSSAILADEQSMVASGIMNFGGSLTGIVAITVLAFLLEYHGQFAALASCSVAALLASVFWIFIDLKKQIGPN